MTGPADWPAETLADVLIRAVEHDPQAFTDPDRLRSAFAVIYPTLEGAQLDALLLPVRMGIPARLEHGDNVPSVATALQGAGWDPATATRYATAYALALGLPVVTTTYQATQAPQQPTQTQQAPQQPTQTQQSTQWANQAPPFPGAGPTATDPVGSTGQHADRPNRTKWMAGAVGAVVLVAAAILVPVLTLGGKGGNGNHSTPPNPPVTTSTHNQSSSSTTPETVSCVNGCTAGQAELANHMPNMVTGCEPPVDNPTISANTGATAAIECEINTGVAQDGDASPTVLFALQYPDSSAVPTTFVTQVSCDNSQSATPTQWFLTSDSTDSNPIGVQGCLDFASASWVVWTYTAQAIEIAASGSGLSTGDLNNWFGDLADANLTAR